MEQGKTRCNSLLAFAVFVNLVLTLTSIGFMVYKVRVLEEQLFQLQTNSSVTSQTETMDNDDGDLTHQRLKRSKSLGDQSCVSCHRACVKLFGLGEAAKVSVCKKRKNNLTDGEQVKYVGRSSSPFVSTKPLISLGT